jgi:hypothetical protein
VGTLIQHRSAAECKPQRQAQQQPAGNLAAGASRARACQTPTARLSPSRNARAGSRRSMRRNVGNFLQRGACCAWRAPPPSPRCTARWPRSSSPCGPRPSSCPLYHGHSRASARRARRHAAAGPRATTSAVLDLQL